jgi:membrane protease YdiL (CAAX protease family)
VIVEALRWLVPPLAAAATAVLFDRRLGRAAGAAEVAGVAGVAIPPGLERPGRRLAARALLAGLFYLTLFAPLSLPPGAAAGIDLSQVSPARLFLMHAILIAGLIGWLALAFGVREAPRAPAGPATREGSPEPADPADPLAFLRLRIRDAGAEIGVGVVAGLVIWAAALAFVALLLAGLKAAGAGDLVPATPPPLIAFVAGQPVWLRLAISLSAGLVEELFFRGFLQPRLGIWVTTGLFVLAHAAYGAPAMFVTVAFLSLAYGWLARRRGSVWAAVAAHTLFDAVQLLLVLPAALRAMEDAPFG